MSQTDTELGALHPLGALCRTKAAEKLPLEAHPRISWAVGEGGRDGLGGQTGWQHPVPWRSMRLWLRGPREAGCAFPFFCSPSQPQERRLRGLTWPGNTFKLHIPTSAHPELTYSQTLQITSASLRFPGQKQLICGSQSCFVAAGLTWVAPLSQWLVGPI